MGLLVSALLAFGVRIADVQNDDDKSVTDDGVEQVEVEDPKSQP